jgi:OOP family OmpA-OmpF porin
MLLKTKARVLSRFLAAVTAASLLAACASSKSSGDPPTGAGTAAMPASCTKAGPVVFAVSGRRDSPAPGLTTRMQIAAQEAARQGSAVGVVNVDGAPTLIVAWFADTRNMNGGAAQLYDVNFVAALARKIQAVRAASPHADVLDALEIAGRAVRAVRAACHTQRGGTIFLEDSGLQDINPLNFTRPGQLEALPPVAVSFLSGEQEIPDLAGMTVVLVGIGDTAAPQPPLAIGQQAHLRAIWSAVIKAGGGQVETDPSPRENPAPRGVPPVNLIAVPRLAPWPEGYKKSFPLPDNGPFGFRPNTAIFRDPSAAQKALSNVARFLLDNPTAKIELTGTTARWGGNKGDVTLSTQRANAVKSALISLGDSPGQLLARGVGWRSPCYERDGGPKGPMLERQAKHNRSVIVTVLPNPVTC